MMFACAKEESSEFPESEESFEYGWVGTKQLGTSSSDFAIGVATDSSGNIYVAGSTQGGLDGNSNSGVSDLFVVKYNSDGNKQ